MVLKLTCPWLKDWNMRPGYKILTEEIQFDVGLLARKEMTLYYNGFKIDLPLIKRLKYESKNDMYPEVSEYILQKVLTCPKCFKTHNHFSNFKYSCLKTCLNNKFPIYKSIKKIVCKRKKCKDKKHVSLLRYLIHVDKQHGYLDPYVARCSKCSEEFKKPNVYLKHSCNPDHSDKTPLL